MLYVYICLYTPVLHMFSIRFTASCPTDNTIENRPVDWTPQICLSSACAIPRVMPEGYVRDRVMEWLTDWDWCFHGWIFGWFIIGWNVGWIVGWFFGWNTLLKNRNVCWKMDQFLDEHFGWNMNDMNVFFVEYGWSFGWNGSMIICTLWGHRPGWQLHLCAWLCPSGASSAMESHGKLLM